MKKSILQLLTVICLFLFTACSEKEEFNPENTLPEEAIHFINNFFPGKKISQLDELTEMSMAGLKYKVILSDNTEIDFNLAGNWLRILSPYNLPEQILTNIYSVQTKWNEINQYYQNPSIIGVESSLYGHTLTLDKGEDVFVFYGDTSYTFGNKINLYELPEKIQTFLVDYIGYKEVTFLVEGVEEGKMKYRINYINNERISFDQQYDWYEIYFPYYSINKKIYSSLPSEIRECITNHDPDFLLRSIYKIDNLYLFNFPQGSNVLIDQEGSIINPPDEKVESFIKEHFEFYEGGDIYKTVSLRYDVFNISVFYTYGIKEGILYLLTDLEGKWDVMQLYKDTNNSQVLPLPTSVITLLPEKLQLFLKQEPYDEMPVTLIYKDKDSIRIQLMNIIELLFTTDGSFIKRIK